VISRKPKNKPNIVYIHSHDTGRFVQPYGFAIPTPNISRLAGKGVLFRQAFAASPTCSPSRASLLTGEYPHNNGMLGLAHRGFSLQDYGHHIIHTLKKQSYTAVLSGVQHIASGNSAWKWIGYDACLEEIRGHVFNGDWEDNNAQEAASNFLDNDPPEPFFLSVGFTETHRIFPPLNEQVNPGHTMALPNLPDHASIREDIARYMISAEYLDKKIGIVLEALERNKLVDNTIVICTTDHGIPFPGMKSNLTALGLGVMLIIRGPEGFAGGRVIDGMVSHLDIFPTICEILNIDPPGWLQGRSLLPLIKGEVAQIHEALFGETNFHAAYEPARSVRTLRWRYIRRFDKRTKPVLPNIDDGPAKTVLLAHGLADRRVDEEALFDLAFDPGEGNNLSNEPEYQDVLAAMRNRLAQWMQETNDPLLDGPLQIPAGAVLDDPDALSPT
jgi:N-sulfoglucosamine sulfohydrolase